MESQHTHSVERNQKKEKSSHPFFKKIYQKQHNMQNNTIAFTILKFPVLVRVQRNFTSVYSIFSFCHSFPRLGADIVILLISVSLAFPPSMFQSTIFLKGTSVVFLVSSQIQTLASPWSKSVVPEWSALRRKSLLFAKGVLNKSSGAAFAKRYRQRTRCVSRSSSALAIAITFSEGGIRVNLVGSGKRAKSGAHQRRSRVLSGQGGSSGLAEV